jgi:hypothetical protein
MMICFVLSNICKTFGIGSTAEIWVFDMRMHWLENTEGEIKNGQSEKMAT